MLPRGGFVNPLNQHRLTRTAATSGWIQRWLKRVFVFIFQRPRVHTIFSSLNTERTSFTKMRIPHFTIDPFLYCFAGWLFLRHPRCLSSVRSLVQLVGGVLAVIGILVTGFPRREANHRSRHSQRVCNGSNSFRNPRCHAWSMFPQLLPCAVMQVWPNDHRGTFELSGDWRRRLWVHRLWAGRRS